jgi:hypothetical protein
MGFHVNKDNGTEENINAEAQRDERRERRERSDRGDREERRERTERSERSNYRQTVDRTFSPVTGEQGRASTFLSTYREILEDMGAKPTCQLMEPDGELMKEMNQEQGFLVMAEQIAGNVYWHLLIFEGQINPVVTYPVHDRNRSRRDDEVLRFVSSIDSVDDELVTRFEDWLRDNAASDGDYVFTNATIIPSEVDVSNKQVVQSLAFDAEDANILISGASVPFSADRLRRNARVRSKIQFSPKPNALDLTGMPLRSDFQIAVEETFRDKVQSTLLASSGGTTLVSLDGYVNARFLGYEVHPDQVRDPRDIDMGVFVPEVIVSQVNTTHKGISDGNFERMMLGLSQLPYIKDNDLWMRQFEQAFHGANGRISGFAYGMEWPRGELPDDLAELDEDPKRGDAWLQNIFNRDDRGRIPVEFVVMIREGGVNFTTSKLLLDLADNDQDAFEHLMNSLDDLTNGEWSAISKAKKASDVISGAVRVPTGYYVTSEGRRPIEDMDTLAILNRLKTNYPDLVADLYDCMAVDERYFNYDEAMTKLNALFKFVTDGEFVLKGFATKLYLNPTFLADLFEAVESSDLDLEVDAASDLAYGRTRRRSYHGTNYGLADNLTNRRRRTHSGRGRGSVHTRYRR